MSIKNFRERSPVAIGILSIIGIAAGTFLAFSVEKIPLVKRVYEIEAEFSDAAGLKPDNQVRIAGIKVGVVNSVELAGDRVLVTMEIQDGIEISHDADAEIKLATLLGTKYVDITARGPEPLMDEGDLIPLDRTKVPYEIYQAANEGTKVLEELDGEALNALLDELADLTSAAKDEIGIALEGLTELGAGLNDRTADFNELVEGADDLTGFLADEGSQINRLIDASNNVLGTLAAQREEIQSLLEATKQMAGELGDLVKDNRRELDSIFRRIHRALLVLEDNVEHLDVALEYAGPSSRYFGGIFQQGRWGDLYTCAIMASILCEADE